MLFLAKVPLVAADLKQGRRYLKSVIVAKRDLSINVWELTLYFFISLLSLCIAGCVRSPWWPLLDLKMYNLIFIWSEFFFLQSTIPMASLGLSFVKTFLLILIQNKCGLKGFLGKLPALKKCSSLLSYSLFIFCRCGVWSKDDHYRWQTDQTADLGYGNYPNFCFRD